MAITVHASFALHPGPWLRRQFVAPLGLTQAALAERLGVTRVALSNVLNGKAALSPDMAMRFADAFGVSALTLLRMQAAHEVARLEADDSRPRVTPISVSRDAAHLHVAA